MKESSRIQQLLEAALRTEDIEGRITAGGPADTYSSEAQKIVFLLPADKSSPNAKSIIAAVSIVWMEFYNLSRKEIKKRSRSFRKIANHLIYDGMHRMCPVCGYPDLDTPAYWQNDPNANGSLEICPSCGFQFGYTDHGKHIAHEQWRMQWIASGMIWRSKGIKPSPNWDPRAQLLNVGMKV